MYQHHFYVMELSIKTLTGTSLELLVSPFDTVHDVKFRIQKLEGIPIPQQHLIWHSEELENERSLREYHIQSGATLQLVLGLRGGPVNTRRVLTDEPSALEMAEYIADSATGFQDDMSLTDQQLPVTYIVYHNGDHFNFFRVVERDMSSSLSCALSGGSGSEYNPSDSPSPKERHEENDRTRQKMQLIRSQMQNLNLMKDKKERVACKSRVTGNRLPSTCKSQETGTRLPSTAQTVSQVTGARPPSTCQSQVTGTRLPSTAQTVNQVTGARPPSTCKSQATGTRSPSTVHTVSHRRLQRLTSTSCDSSTALVSLLHKSAPCDGGGSTMPLLNKNVLLPPIGPIHAALDPQLMVANSSSQSVSTCSPPQHSVPFKQSPMLADSSCEPSQHESDMVTIATTCSKVPPVQSQPVVTLTTTCAKVPPVPPISQLGPAVVTMTTPLSNLSTVNHVMSDQSVATVCRCETNAAAAAITVDVSCSSSCTVTTVTQSNSVGSPVLCSSDSVLHTVDTSTTTTNKPSAVQHSGGHHHKIPDVMSPLEDFSQPGLPQRRAISKPPGIKLQSLNMQEVRAMSGMLNTLVCNQSCTGFPPSTDIPPSAGTSASGNELSETSVNLPPAGERSHLMSALGRQSQLRKLSAGRSRSRISSSLFHIPSISMSSLHKKSSTKHCSFCGKRTRLAMCFQCRCGNNFCSIHRYAEAHSCTFDYKADGRKLLEQNNPVIAAPKLPKI